MMKTLMYGLCCLLCLTTFLACQKELSLENGKPSAGSLKDEVTGECLPKTVAGTYVAGKNLGDTNFIEVEVEVSQPGSYTILTDTVNGYSFKATGNFANAGANLVKLTGSGRPATAGIDDFIVVFDTSFCFVSVEVLPGEIVGDAAVFTLSNAPNECGNAQVAGTFTKGTTLTATNKVTLNLDVTTAGTYAISTNTVNGYSFSGSGILTGTGTQTIELVATGTPVSDGVNVFTVTAGSSTCTFSVTVTDAAPVAGEYFPLTQNSWWSYSDPMTAGDTILRNSLDEASGNGNIYREIEEVYETGEVAYYYYRKAGNDYFEYTEVDNYSILTFDDDTEGEILFLKANLATNETWSSAEFSGSEDGVPKKLKYVFTCTNAAATATIGGKSFSDVYKISFKPQVSTGGGPFTDEGVIWEAWYAKNIGLIFLKATVGGTTAYEINIKNWQNQ